MDFQSYSVYQSSTQVKSSTGDGKNMEKRQSLFKKYRIVKLKTYQINLNIAFIYLVELGKKSMQMS